MDLSLLLFINAIIHLSIFSWFRISIKTLLSFSLLEKMKCDGLSYLPHLHNANSSFQHLYFRCQFLQTKIIWWSEFTTLKVETDHDRILFFRPVFSKLSCQFSFHCNLLVLTLSLYHKAKYSDSIFVFDFSGFFGTWLNKIHEDF